MFLNILSFFPTFLFYTDPGSGQLILQLLIATLLGGLFYFRKLKDFIFRKSSPENKKSKLKESDALKVSGE